MNIVFFTMAKSMKPFLKWPGGKRWLADTMANLFSNTGRYIEPFLGAGAVFFALQPRKALLSDVNKDLMSAFQAVRDDAGLVIRQLSRLGINKKTFRNFRVSAPNDVLNRAIRLIYLNRTAFNGIYRVNFKGEFNVPFGCKKNTKICDAERIRGCSHALKGTILHCVDFRVMLEQVRPDDAVFIDPPYTVKHDNNGFRRYNERIFSWKDQVDLAQELNRLAGSGTQIVVSNALHREILALYSRRNFTALEVKRSSCMAADSLYRGKCDELLLVSRSIAGSTDIPMVLNKTRVTGRILD
jgi:DNA adenine methylase